MTATRRWQRLISLLLAVVLTAGLLPAPAAAESGVTDTDIWRDSVEWTDPSNNFTYSFDVYERNGATSSDAEIVETNLYAVLKRCTAPSGSTSVTATVPATVTFTYGTIINGDTGEFEDGQTYTAPVKVINTKNYYYYDNANWSDGIRHIVLPASVERIEEQAMYKLTDLETVTFAPDSQLKYIGDCAFQECSSLTNFAFPDSVETIGKEAFLSTKLNSVTLGSGLKTLGIRAFKDNYDLAVLDMSAVTRLEVIPEECFAYHQIADIVIPDCVTTIAYEAFYRGYAYNDETNTVSLTLGSGVETIGEEAFFGLQNLTGTLALPDSLESIGEEAFHYCGFTDITWPQNNPAFTEVNGFAFCTNLPGSVIASLPFSVTTIGEHAFDGCKLGAVTIPGHVKTIGAHAFDSAGITELTINYGVEFIGAAAFSWPEGLLGKTVTLPASVTELRTNAFGYPGDSDYTYSGEKPLTVEILNKDMILTHDPANFDETHLCNYYYNCGYAYYAADDTDRSNAIYVYDPFGHINNLILRAPAGESTAKSYAEQMNGTYYATLSSTNIVRSVKFEPIQDAPVYYNVTVPQVDGVSFTVKQNNTVLSQSESAALAQSGQDVVVIAHKNGYYDQTLVKQGGSFTADWVITKEDLSEWVPIPVSDLLLTAVTINGNPIGSFEGLKLSLKKGEEMVSFTQSYPYLVLNENHGLNADDELTLTVTPDAGMQISDGTAAGSIGSGITLELKRWGTVQVGVGGRSVGCVVVVFDGDGKAVSAGTTTVGMFTSAPLPAGNYIVVSYEINDYFGAVGHYADLSGMGLTTADYAEQSVTISDGAAATVSLSVPTLRTANLTSALDTGKCAVALRVSNIVTDVPFDMQVSYALKDENAAGDKTLRFILPEGVEIKSAYNSSGELVVSGNAVVVSEASGTVYLRLECSSAGEKYFSASLDVGTAKLLLGSASAMARPLTVDIGSTYLREKSGNQIMVYTKPEAPVTVTGAKETVTETANKAGKAILTYALPDDASYGQRFTIQVSANGGSSDFTVIYMPASETPGAVLSKLYMYHHGYRQCIMDNDNRDEEESYYVYYATGKEEDKYFTFQAEIRDGYELQDVTLLISMQDGSEVSVPLSLIKTDANENLRTYAGELYIDGNKDDHVFHPNAIPVGFQVIWNEIMPEEPAAALPSGQIIADVQAKAEKREKSMEFILGGERSVLTAEALKESLIEAHVRALGDGKTTDDLEKGELEGIEAAVERFAERYPDGYVPTFFGYAYREEPIGGLMTKAECEQFKEEIRNNANLSDETKTAQIAYLQEFYDSQEDYLASCYENDAWMDECAAILTEFFGLEKPLQEYESWDDVLEEAGVKIEDCTETTADLQVAGFQEVDDGCWYKENGDGSYTVAFPTTTAPAPAARSGAAAMRAPASTSANDGYSGGKVTVNPTDTLLDVSRTGMEYGVEALSKRFIDAANKDNTWAAEKLANLSKDHPGDDNFYFRRRMRDYLDDRMDENNKAIQQSKTFKQLGRALGVYNIYNDGEQLNKNIVETAESEARASELDVLLNYCEMHGDCGECQKALIAEKEAYDELNMWMKGKNVLLGLNMAVGTAAFCADVLSLGTAGKAQIIYDAGSTVAMTTADFRIAYLQKQIDFLHAKRVIACGGEGWKNMRKRNITPILDPSGTVYEAVESNLLSGVTATVYEVTEDGTRIEWNASEYDQVNPQITGTDGSYAWNVPSGTWQVKFTKDGYSDAQTEPMDVPPPRMNLKNAMVSTLAPTVVNAAAYRDCVELVFSQYMDVTAAMTVPDGYSYKWVDPVPVSEGNSTKYAKILHLIPTENHELGEKISVTLEGAKNYAGCELGSYSGGELTVSVRPAKIRLNYEKQIAVLMNESPVPRITVQVLDETGFPISGLAVTGALSDTLTANLSAVHDVTDEKGIAVFSAEGLLPGLTQATFAVENSSLRVTMPLRVSINENRVAKPTAQIEGRQYTQNSNDITVAKGAQLILDCDTPGATLYYTLNDSCPCQSTDRIPYAGPITVNEDTYFRIAAYKDGMEYSERLNLRIHVVDTPPAMTYDLSLAQTENGSITVSSKSASQGDTVTVSATPNKGYKLDTLIVLDQDGKEVKLTEKDGKYSFEMPASKVTVKASFKKIVVVNPYVDVKAGDYFYDAVLWAIENDVTKGTSAATFSPDDSCTRAQIVTFLWRASGSPEAKSTASFADVKAGSYYAKAVAWAIEQGITKGTSATTFSPDEVCTRAQAVTFLSRALKGKAAAGSTFSDVPAKSYYAEAVAWAVENGITYGTSATTFSPDEVCTRGQIVTFLFRAMAE